MSTNYYVIDPLNDPRYPYLAEVPILQTLDDIIAHFCPITVDETRGWAATPSGQPCWKLVGFHVTVGSIVLSPKVLDQDSNYIKDKWVHWRYPGAPKQLAVGGQPAYFAEGLSAKTKWEGNGAEFVVSGDHNVAPGHSGPDSIWVAVEPEGPQYSDAVHGLGMRVNTNHLIVSPIFQYVVKGTPITPLESLEQALSAAGKPLIMPLDREASLYKAAKKKRLGERLTPEYEVKHAGKTYVAQLYEKGLVYAVKGDWENIQVIRQPA